MPWDIPKANPRAAPSGLPSENPMASDSSPGSPDNPKAFQQFVPFHPYVTCHIWFTELYTMSIPILLMIQDDLKTTDWN